MGSAATFVIGWELLYSWSRGCVKVVPRSSGQQHQQKTPFSYFLPSSSSFFASSPPLTIIYTTKLQTSLIYFYIFLFYAGLLILSGIIFCGD